MRLDGARPLVELLAEGYEVSLKFLQPPGCGFRRDDGRRDVEPAWSASDAG